MPASAALDQVVTLFESMYGDAPTVIASAPGRVNLIGEHLDYNSGPVLPLAIERRVWVAVGAAHGFTMVSSATGGAPIRRAEGFIEGNWSDYVMGVVQELRKIGVGMAGAQLAVVSDIEQGAGLSSSAALTVASAAAFGQLAGQELSHDALTDIAFRAEHDYVGVRCGRMDQTIVAHAVEGTAMLLDTATGAITTSPFPHEVWILPTGITHALADGGYNARRRECEEALQRCRERWPGLQSLAALDLVMLAEAAALLPPTLFQRARHVVTEVDRTWRAERALENGDLEEVGRLLVASHESLKTDFESTVTEADFLVELAVGRGAFGARLTGAGWGGSVVMLAPARREGEIVKGACTAFAQRFGRMPAAWGTRASGGVRVDFAA